MHYAIIQHISLLSMKGIKPIDEMTNQAKVKPNLSVFQTADTKGLILRVNASTFTWAVIDETPSLMNRA